MVTVGTELYARWKHQVDNCNELYGQYPMSLEYALYWRTKKQFDCEIPPWTRAANHVNDDASASCMDSNQDVECDYNLYSSDDGSDGFLSGMQDDSDQDKGTSSTGDAASYNMEDDVDPASAFATDHAINMQLEPPMRPAVVATAALTTQGVDRVLGGEDQHVNGKKREREDEDNGDAYDAFGGQGGSKRARV